MSYQSRSEIKEWFREKFAYNIVRKICETRHIERMLLFKWCVGYPI